MPALHHPGWLDRNAARAYPLTDDVPATSTRGWTLPHGLLVDASIAVESAAGGVGVQSVCFSPRLVHVVLADIATGAPLAVAVGSTAPGPRSVQLQPLADGVSGSVTFGSLPDLSAFLVGSQHFDPPVPLAARAVLATGPFPLRSLNGLNGEVGLSAGGALLMVASAETDGDGEPVTVFNLSLAGPESFLSPCDRPGNSPCRQTPIRSVNGVFGDDDGNITVEFVGFSSQRAVGNSVRVLQLQAGDDYCRREPMPDQYGRLPDDYGADCPPVTVYHEGTVVVDPGPACV